MKNIFIVLFFLSITMVISAQTKLYYFINADSTAVGVKNDTGKIIIPAKFSALTSYDLENPITEPTIEFYGTSTRLKANPKAIAVPGGEVYDREGNFLYYPLLFNNGPDYWEENLRRFTENGKVGFVDKLGNKIIPALWEFATPFENGTAEVFVGGWKKKYEHGDEHWSLVPSSKKSKKYFIDKKGKRVKKKN